MHHQEGLQLDKDRFWLKERQRLCCAGGNRDSDCSSMHHTKSYIFSKPNKKIHGAYVVSDRKITVDSGFRLYHRGYAVPKISGATITIIVIR